MAEGTAPATGSGSGPATGDPSTTPPASAATPATGTAPATGDPTSPTLTPEQITELVESNRRMQDALQKANREAQDRREQAKQAERDKMTAEEATKAELEDLRTRAENWEVERASFHLEREVSRLTTKLGIIDPEVVVRLIDWDDVDFEEGIPKNVEKLVSAILSERPYLVGKPNAPAPQARPTGLNAGAGQGEGQSAVNLTAAEMEAAKQAGISPERYQALKGVQTLDQWQATRRTGGGTS
jgi:hypothetical protein